MKRYSTRTALFSILVIAISFGSILGQQSKSTIFAVLNDGKALEPIAHIEDKKLSAPVNGSDELSKKVTFAAAYYKPKAVYKLIFGGADAGIVTVESSSPQSECSSNMAQASVISKRTRLRGFIMGLATDLAPAKAGSGVRRLPTPAERSEIESLVKAEFVKQKLPKNKMADLKYHNLTAMDFDGDGIAEQVGSFFIPTPKQRALLFFIAWKGKDGKYRFGYKDFRTVKESEVMNEEIETLDTGVYNELLLDVYDYNGDGISEVFTILQGFEGSTFNAYEIKDGKWVKAYEFANYHCGF
ncbi:MAG: hypothetical protein HKN25_13025 [Pyrinomonadaceae bacterium]|nr:hypothetical protein [Pyrinomonadaceae bacterium]